MSPFELEPQALALVELGNRRSGADNQFHTMVVELVYETHEAPRRVFVLAREYRHVAQDHGMEHHGEFYVVVLAARSLAQIPEIEPDDVVRHLAGPNVASFNAQHHILTRDFGSQGREAPRQTRLGSRVEWRMIDFGLFQRAQAKIQTVADMVHSGVLVQKIDCRQKAPPLQTVFIKMRRLDVRGSHQGNAALEQRRKQLAQNHGVTNVRDEKFVETQDLRVGGKTIGYGLQRVRIARGTAKIVMHTTHETVEVHAQPPPRGEAVVEQIHEHGLTAAHATPDIQSLERRRCRTETQLSNPLRKRIRRGFRGDEALIQIFEQSDDLRLRLVLLKLPTLEFLLVLFCW